MSIIVDSRAKALIFDIDGTLADNMPIHYESWQMVVSDLGGSFPEDLFYDWAGIPTYQITEMLNEKYGSTMDPFEAVRLKEQYFFKLLGNIKPIKSVVDIVQRYHKRLPMACGTGGRKKIAKRILGDLNLIDYFEVIIAAEDVKNHKPDPETFLKCSDFLKISPEHCLVFEDGEKGIEAAKKAGMMVVDVRPYM